MQIGRFEARFPDNVLYESEETASKELSKLAETDATYCGKETAQLAAVAQKRLPHLS